MQKNNHARSKQNRRKLKRKVLLMFNFIRRVFEKREKKMKEARRIKGRTIQGIRAVTVAKYHAPTRGGMRMGRNQKQKRRDARRANFNKKQWNKCRSFRRAA